MIIDTKYTLSRQIRHAVKQQHGSLYSCVKSFNNKYIKEISSGEIQRLNKDFVSRLQQGKFKVVSERISIICEFLDIDIHSPSHHREPSSLGQLGFELEAFKEFAQKSSPELEKRYPVLFEFLNSFAALTESDRG